MENEKIKVEEEMETVEQIQAARIEDLESKLADAVDPEEYKKLQKELKRVMQNQVFKREVPEKKELKPAKELAEKLSEISDGDVTNREYWKLSLEYRDSFMEEFGKDPWTDGAGEETPKTKLIADTVRGLLDEFKNPVSFRTQFNEILKDDPSVTVALRNKNKKRK